MRKQSCRRRLWKSKIGKCDSASRNLQSARSMVRKDSAKDQDGRSGVNPQGNQWFRKMQKQSCGRKLWKSKIGKCVSASCIPQYAMQKQNCGKDLAEIQNVMFLHPAIWRDWTNDVSSAKLDQWCGRRLAERH